MSIPTPPSRRDFLLALGGGALAWPTLLAGLDRELRPSAADGRRSMAEWEEVRRQFLIPEDRIYLNNGTIGPQPRVVVDALTEHAERVAMTFPPRLDWEDVNSRLSALLGGDPEGFVVSRNTTEAMNVIANGLDLNPGDEVVITDQEHIGGKSPWELVCTRRRAILRAAKLPIPGEDEVDADTLLAAIWREVGPRTRVVSVSHVTFTNGAILPVEAIARRCRDAGIVCVLDGAHPPGLMPVDLDQIRPDFYASSPHKWLCAPQGTGLIWMAPKWRDTLWPTLASGDWQSGGALRFNHVGTMDESRVAGLIAALEFHESVGRTQIFERAVELQGYLRAGLQEISGLTVRSPALSDSAGMVSFEIDGIVSLELQQHLSRVARIRTRVISEYDLGWMRLSTHFYNLERDLDTVLDHLEQVARDGLPATG